MRAPLLKVALLVGGPSPEAGISLNSARSVADHLDGGEVAISLVIYFDKRSRAYEISRALLYSNTPEDFDFKLSRSSRPLEHQELAERLKTCDMAFPVMHGELGEDGGVQSLLEGFGVPYVGSGPHACARAYDKWTAFEHLRGHGVGVVPSLLVPPAPGPGWPGPGPLEELGQALGLPRAEAREQSRFVAKPRRGGSSLGVEVLSEQEAAERLASGHNGPGLVLQPYVRGLELTVVVLEGPDGPVALPPVEVERRADSGPDFLTYQDKYLASDDVRYYCPPRPCVPDGLVASLRALAEDAFRALGLRDFARIDCWALEDGRALVSDINPISGMEQNSYLFIQASQVGLSHRDVLRLVLSAACQRVGLGPLAPLRAGDEEGGGDGRLPVAVLFGGATAERQVSVLSGTNVWLKLACSDRYAPSPFLLSPDDDEEGLGQVWELNYALALRHSAEAIQEACQLAPEVEPRRAALAADVVARLGLSPGDCTLDLHQPRAMPLDELVAGWPFVFIALHGGQGEDGTLQRLLDDKGVAYNGSGPEASALCIDKYRTSLALAGLEDQGAHTARKLQVEVAGLDHQGLWARVTAGCGTAKLIVKPLSDGCSAGVVPLANEAELLAYLEALRSGAPVLVTPGTGLEVAMPPGRTTHLLFEEYFETDDLAIVAVPAADGHPGATRLAWARERDTGWVEVTVGVLGHHGTLAALPPSVTVARRGVLSLQEKFMGGTGVNITPPPSPPLGRVATTAVARARHLVERVAEQLGIEGYARIDIFMHRATGEIVVIEANSLPGLTPSTVLYHQALAQDPPLFPRDLLERLVELGLEHRERQGRP